MEGGALSSRPTRRQCSARKPLEFHHVHPYAAGGEATIGNIELRCRSHNAYEAELFYGASGTTRPGASWLESRPNSESTYPGRPVVGSETQDRRLSVKG